MKYLSAFIKKSSLLLLFITQCPCFLPLEAMEIAEISPMENLPPNVAFNIAMNVVPKKIIDSSQLVKAFADLTKLMGTNRQFYDLIRSEYFLETLEKKLSKRIAGSGIIVRASQRLEGLGKIYEPFIQVLENAENQLKRLEAVETSISQSSVSTWTPQGIIGMTLKTQLPKIKALLPRIKKRNFSIYDKFSGEDVPTLIFAIRIGGSEGIELTRLLLEHGANPNIRGHEIFTPIHTVFEHNETGSMAEFIALLLNYGANIEEKDVVGDTPLISAARSSFYDLVELLIKHGAKIEAKNSEGATPLLSVPNREMSTVDQIKTLLILIKHGADVNAQTNTGKTTLMLAVKHNQLHLVRWLLRHGAAVDLTDNNGRTAISMAREKNRQEIEKLLADK